MSETIDATAGPDRRTRAGEHLSPARRAGDDATSPGPWCRVLVVDHRLGVWGAQRYLLRLAPLLAARGVEQVLAAPAGPLARAWCEGGGRWLPIRVATDRTLRGTNRFASAARLGREALRQCSGVAQVASAARRAGADVLAVNSHGWAFTEVVAAGRLLRRPVAVHLHGELEASPVGRLWARAIAAADATVAVSHAVTRRLPGGGGGRVRVVPNGVDPRRFSPGPADPSARAALTDDPAAPVVLVLARLEPGKGIDDVVRAVAALPPPLSHARLAVAGAAPDLPTPGYEQGLRELGRRLLGGRLRLLGARSDPERLVRAADVVVLASRSEGFGLCVLEAQSCARPVVAYPAGGVAEVITDGVDGLLAAQDDVADLSRRIAEVLADAGLAARLGAAGRARVLARGTLERQADAQVEVLRDLLGRATRSARRG